MNSDIDSPDYNDTNQGDCRETEEEGDIIRLEKRLIEEMKWKALSVTAVAADNPNVADYLKQVEEQLATARENEASASSDLLACQRENERLRRLISGAQINFNDIALLATDAIKDTKKP